MKKDKIMKKRDNLPLNYKERLNSRTSFLVSIAVLVVLCLVFNQMDYSMIRQPAAGTQGKVTDMEIDVERFLKIKARMNRIMAENTGKTPEQIKADSERDHWLLAEEAREYGLIDKVIYKR